MDIRIPKNIKVNSHWYKVLMKARDDLYSDDVKKQTKGMCTIAAILYVQENETEKQGTKSMLKSDDLYIQYKSGQISKKDLEEALCFSGSGSVWGWLQKKEKEQHKYIVLKEEEQEIGRKILKKVFIPLLKKDPLTFDIMLMKSLYFQDKQIMKETEWDQSWRWFRHKLDNIYTAINI